MAFLLAKRNIIFISERFFPVKAAPDAPQLRSVLYRSILFCVEICVELYCYNKESDTHHASV